MKTITITVDDHDYDAIQEAIARRQAFRPLLDAGDGFLIGRVLAEICRDWDDLMEWAGKFDKGEKWKRGPSGDQT